jgi:hypothetical protein
MQHLLLSMSLQLAQRCEIHEYLSWNEIDTKSALKH